MNLKIDSETLANTDIDKILTEDFNELNVIGVVIVNRFNWGRLDKVILEKYGNSIDLYSYWEHILSFNGINDPSEIKLGMGLLLPDMSEYLSNSWINAILDNSKIGMEKTLEVSDIIQIPGVNRRTISTNILRAKNPGETAFQEGITNPDFTIGNPKLNIRLKKIQYSPATGQIAISKS
jgi:hypothetical protein